MCRSTRRETRPCVSALSPLPAHLLVWSTASRFKGCKTTLVGWEGRSDSDGSGIWQRFGLLMSRLRTGRLKEAFSPTPQLCGPAAETRELFRTIKVADIRLHLKSRGGGWFYFFSHLYWAIKLQGSNFKCWVANVEGQCSSWSKNCV